jgi:transcriptional regulator with XRE-family HTH domain
MENIHQRIGKNLRRLIQSRGITEEKFAINVDIEKSHLSRVIGGKASTTLNTLERFCKELKADYQELFKP